VWTTVNSVICPFNPRSGIVFAGFTCIGTQSI
jgi:hypothetical protein